MLSELLQRRQSAESSAMPLVEAYVDTVMGTVDIMATVITDRIEALGLLLAPVLAQQ
jgi:hypothetical protein